MGLRETTFEELLFALILYWSRWLLIFVGFRCKLVWLKRNIQFWKFKKSSNVNTGLREIALHHFTLCTCLSSTCYGGSIYVGFRCKLSLVK